MLKAFKDKIMLRSHGFMREADVEELTKIARLHPVLVRCGNGRFTCPAQNVIHFIAAIEAGGKDYVRDVSLPYDPAQASIIARQAIDKANDMSAARDDHNCDPELPENECPACSEDMNNSRDDFEF